MQLTQKHIEYLKAYYRTHAESTEQPASVKASYAGAIAKLDAMTCPTVEQVAALIDAELENARQCRGDVSLDDTDRMFRHSEKARKFRIGIPLITADRWIEQPDLLPCCHGDHREWHIAEGANYQEQLWCRLRKCCINPSGRSCEGCYQRKKHVASLSRQDAGDWIVQMVEQEQMTQDEALQLVKEFSLETD